MRYIPLLLLELKGFLAEYRRLLCFCLAGLLLFLALPVAASALDEAGMLFRAPDSVRIGLVTEDTSPELAILFDFFDQEIMPMVPMSKAEAQGELAAGRILAYVELPENFAADIFRGANTPFTLHVSANAPLEGQLADILATAGIAYLSAAQAGIYATIDEARAQGLSAEQIGRQVLLPVNVAFAMTLLEFEERFAGEILPLLGYTTPTEYLAKRFVVFWYMLGLAILAKLLRSPRGLAARFKLAGISTQMNVLRFLAFLIVQALLTMPLLYFWNIGMVIAIAFFLTAFAEFAVSVFEEDAPCGLFIVFVAFAMWFLSGGIVPPAFLPQEIWLLRFLSAGYLAAEGLWYVLVGAALALCLCSKNKFDAHHCVGV